MPLAPTANRPWRTALNNEGLTILLVEQLASYALGIADYGFVVANGRIAHEGPSASLSRNPDVMEAFRGKKKLPSDLTSKASGVDMAQRIIDLSLTIEDNMPAHKLFQRPVIALHMSHESTKSQNLGVPGDAMTFQTNFIAMLDHVGTHVDAYRHVNPKGAPVDEMPLQTFMGKAVCFDLQHIPDLGDITAADMEAAEKKAGVKVDGHIVLLCTGFHKRNYPSIDSVWKNPLLTVEATRWLFDRKSKMHGVEGPSTDKPTDNIFAQHRLCRDLGISHWEWLVNLEELLGKGEFQFFGVPLKFKGGSGSPVRAFAIVG